MTINDLVCVGQVSIAVVACVHIICKTIRHCADADAQSIVRANSIKEELIRMQNQINSILTTDKSSKSDTAE